MNDTARLTLPDQPPGSDSETYAALVTIGGAIAAAAQGQVTELYRGGEMIARIVPPHRITAALARANRDDTRERLARNQPGFAAALRAAEMRECR